MDDDGFFPFPLLFLFFILFFVVLDDDDDKPASQEEQTQTVLVQAQQIADTLGDPSRTGYNDKTWDEHDEAEILKVMESDKSSLEEVDQETLQNWLNRNLEQEPASQE